MKAVVLLVLFLTSIIIVVMLKVKAKTKAKLSPKVFQRLPRSDHHILEHCREHVIDDCEESRWE